MKANQWRQYDVDLAGLGLLVAVTVVGYALAIHGPLSDSFRHDRARREQEEMALKVASLRARGAAIEAKIEHAKHRLSSMEAKLLDSHAVDEVIARLHDAASQCKVVLTRFQPTVASRQTGYQSRKFLVEGHGPFRALHRWFSQIESDVPYLDVTHFSIRSSGKQVSQADGESVCHFECSQRLYLGESDAAGTALAGQP